MIRSFLASALLLFLNLFSTGPVAQTQKVDGIVWSQTRLEWDNFKEDNTVEKYPGKLARSFTKLYVTDGDTTGAHITQVIKLHVYALFIPALSWVRQSNIGKKSVLAHEQLHFDIVELMARRLRKQLSQQQVTLSNYEKIINKAKRYAFKELRKMQSKYDETHKTKWQMWVDNIHNELADLAGYSSVEVFIPLGNK